MTDAPQDPVPGPVFDSANPALRDPANQVSTKAPMLWMVGAVLRSLVLLAALLCGGGSWVTARLFQRTVNTAGTQRLGWQVLTAISAGVAIWCTHFIAMLGFEAGALTCRGLAGLVRLGGQGGRFFMRRDRFGGRRCGSGEGPHDRAGQTDQRPGLGQQPGAERR